MGTDGENGVYDWQKEGDTVNESQKSPEVKESAETFESKIDAMLINCVKNPDYRYWPSDYTEAVNTWGLKCSEDDVYSSLRRLAAQGVIEWKDDHYEPKTN